MINPQKSRTHSLHLIGAATLAFGLAMASGCASTGQGYGSNGNYNSSSYSNCYDCGTVTSIQGSSNGKTGAVIGGIIGAVAGHEVSAHTGGSTGNQNLSTVAGAAAGAVAGNAIAKNRAATTYGGYVVNIRMNDGRMTAVNQTDLNGIREGSRVRISNGQAYLQ